MLRTRLTAALASLALALPATAQDTLHIRGTVTAVEGDVVTIDTTADETVEVTMAPDYALVVYTAIAVGDLAEGDYLSIPSTSGAGGEKVALSINVFPEPMRGRGEGENPWDLTADSLMTNATIGSVATAPEGDMVTVTHGDVEEPILVPEGTPITRFAPDPDRRLEAGDQTIVFAQRDGDAIRGGFAGVSADGSLPPV